MRDPIGVARIGPGPGARTVSDCGPEPVWTELGAVASWVRLVACGASARKLPGAAAGWLKEVLGGHGGLSGPLCALLLLPLSWGAKGGGGGISLRLTCGGAASGAVRIVLPGLPEGLVLGAEGTVAGLGGGEGSAAGGGESRVASEAGVGERGGGESLDAQASGGGAGGMKLEIETAVWIRLVIALVLISDWPAQQRSMCVRREPAAVHGPAAALAGSSTGEQPNPVQGMVSTASQPARLWTGQEWLQLGLCCSTAGSPAPSWTPANSSASWRGSMSRRRIPIALNHRLHGRMHSAGTTAPLSAAHLPSVHVLRCPSEPVGGLLLLVSSGMGCSFLTSACQRKPMTPARHLPHWWRSPSQALG